MVNNNINIGNNKVFVQFYNVIICQGFVVDINEIVEFMFGVVFFSGFCIISQLCLCVIQGVNKSQGYGFCCVVRGNVFVEFGCIIIVFFWFKESFDLIFKGKV